MTTKPHGSRRRLKKTTSAPAEQGMFRASDGVELYFEDTGGDGPTLFYVYGLGCSPQHWKYPMAYFSGQSLHPSDPAGAQRTYRQIWMDFRGHGRSQQPRSGQRLTINLIANDTREFCAARGIGHAVFLGQSMGGAIALQLAHDDPKLVAALVLLASPGRDPSQHLPLQPLSRWLWQALIKVNRSAPLALRLGYFLLKPQLQLTPLALTLREFIRWNGFNPLLSRTEDIDEYITKIFEVSPTQFYDLAEDLTVFDVARLGAKIQCPALVIAGAGDQIVPLREARRLARHLPFSELFVVKHGSHCPHFDDPGLVCRRIEQFLKGLHA